MSKMTNLLFTYGTLQIPDVMETVSGSVPKWVEAQVRGYSQYRLIDRIYPGMIAREEGTTSGRVYVDVGAVAWGLLDRFEDPVYERQEVRVHLADGNAMKAQAYVLPLRYAHLLSSEPWAISWFAEHHAQDYVRRCRLFYHMITLT
ncbi:MAG: gamma-glutamylcyclotransferase family protein [Nitrospirales bacterium]